MGIKSIKITQETRFIGNHSIVIAKRAHMNPSTPHPVIILLSDSYFDQFNIFKASKKGFFVKDFIKTFAYWNISTVIPMKHHNKTTLIPSIYYYLQQQPDIDPQQIYILSFGDACPIALSAFKYRIEINKLILIRPSLDISKGLLYPHQTSKYLNKIPPTLIIENKRKFSWRKNHERQIKRFLRHTNTSHHIIHYDEPREWFWDPSHAFVFDIFYFLFQDLPPTILNVPHSFHPSIM